MNKHVRKALTPELTHTWTLALFPAAVLLGVAYMIVTNKEITADIVALFIGLLTAPAIQAAVRKKEDNSANSSDPSNSSGGVRSPRRKELEDGDRRWPYDPDYWNDYRLGLWHRKMGNLPAAIANI